MHRSVVNIILLSTTLFALGHAQLQSAAPSSAVASASIPIQSATEFFDNAPSTVTIGELLQIFEDEDIPNDISTADTSNSNGNSMTSPLTDRSFRTSNPRGLPSAALQTRDRVAPLSPFEKLSSQRTLSLSYNSTVGGYNLVIPGCLSATDIIGQIEAPNGTVINNATLGNLVNVLQLPGDALYNYTLTFLNQTINNINETLNLILCEGASRNLLWSLRPDWRDPNNPSDGFYSAYLIGAIGVVGIGYGGTRLAVIHEGPTANITLNREVGILTATGAANYLFVIALFRLQSLEGRYLGKAEAYILNAFIWVGAQLLKLLEVIAGATCMAAKSIGVAGYKTYTGAGTMIQSWSHQDLLGLHSGAQGTSSSGDIESQVTTAQMAEAANIAAVQGAAFAAAATDQNVQGQLAGGTPGQTCG